MSKSKRVRTTSSAGNSPESDGEPKKLFPDGYDELLHGDSNDRKFLNSLTERQREEELLKRHEERENRNRREAIKNRLKSKAGDQSSTSVMINSEEEGEIGDEDDEKSHQNDKTRITRDNDSDNDNESPSATLRKSTKSSLSNDIYAADENDDDGRIAATNRRKQVNSAKQKETQHSKSLIALREERERKTKLAEEKAKKSAAKAAAAVAAAGDSSSDEEAFDSKTGIKAAVNKEERLKLADVYSDSSSDDDDNDGQNATNQLRKRSRSPENEEDTREQAAKRKRCTSISMKEQLKSMTLSRFRMEKWCHHPFFGSLCKGAFVRINIGQNSGTPIYRICEIIDVVETGKVYQLGQTRTNKGLKLKHANNERVFRLEYVSNAEMSDAEFTRWREAVLKQGISLPSIEDMEKKVKDLEKAKSYKLTDRDITLIVEEKKRFRKNTINFAMNKNELLKDIEEAKEENNSEKVDQLKQELAELEARAKELDRVRSENISTISQINQKNRIQTNRNVEAALVRGAQEQRNAPPDPFTRRRCEPVLVTKSQPSKSDLIQKLQEHRRVAEKKAEEEQRLLGNLSLLKTTTIITTTTTETTTTTDSKQALSQKSSSTLYERGSFTMPHGEHNDDLFTSHDFEVELAF